MSDLTPIPVNILLVEDHMPDVELTLRAFKRAKVVNKVHVARDGVEALDFLMKRGRWENAPTPNIILLDLHMPRLNGWDLLAMIQGEESLARVPVVVLTTSAAGPDIDRAYAVGANSYVVKPFGISGFADAISRIEGFWFFLAKLPESQ